MKIICWNMGAGFAFSSQRHGSAWEWLNAQNADVALVQEAVPLEDFVDPWESVVFQSKWGKDWGSGVLVRLGNYERWEPAESQPWLQRVGGAVAVARPTEGDGLWFASTHSDSSSFESTNRRYSSTYGDLPDREGILRCSPKEMWEIEVIAHELAPVLSSRRFVLGGDLNSSLLFDKSPGGQEARLFSNLATLGFNDLRPRHSEAEVQTYFKPNKRPFQLDHIFADAPTESTVTRWEVLSHVATDLALSDHAPIVVEITYDA